MNEIDLDYDYLEAMSGSFATCFEKACEAAEDASHVERSSDSSALQTYIVKLSEKIKGSVQLILDSFSSTDHKMKEEAQKIIGVEVYDYAAKTMYSQPVQKNIQNNLNYWLTINDSNANQIGINGNYAWCDKFADYVITTSGQKSPGKTLTAMWDNLYADNLIHGYSGSEEVWTEFNKRWDTNVHTDSYIPNTGDLVFFNWKNYDGGFTSVDHVGVVFIDPSDGITYVVHGNYGHRVQKTRLDELTANSDHVTLGDMKSYNKLHK